MQPSVVIVADEREPKQESQMTGPDSGADDHPALVSLAPTAVLRKLSGVARPREVALREYQDRNNERRGRITPVLWPFWAPGPEEFFRWRVQLECSCIAEVMTRSENDLPAERRWLDHVHGAALPTGQLLCSHDDSPPSPYREIVKWGNSRERSFPADPVEAQHGLDPHTWALIRRDEPHTAAFWTVTLSCGHVTEVVASDLAWKPADGPKRVDAKRQQEMLAEFNEFCISHPDRQGESEREHTKRMLAQGWPAPETERLCYTCPRARFIVAYEHVGWLVPRKPERKPKSTPPKPPSRASLKRRLREAEAEAKRLREQLA